MRKKISDIFSFVLIVLLSVVIQGGVVKATEESCKHENGTEIKDSVEATCKTVGYTGDTYCKDCGEKIKDGEEIPINKSNHMGEKETKNSVEVTCETAGYTGDTYCKDCGEKIKDGEEIPAKGHKYTANFTWKDDYSVTVELVCESNQNHKKNPEVVNVTEKIEKVATCNSKGQKQYIAMVKEDGKEYTKTKDVEIPINKDNHAYGKEVYKWEDDESAAKVVLTCQNNNNHIKEYSLTLSATEIKKATCVTKGEMYYTASKEIDGQSYYDDKTIITSIDPENHIGETKIANVKSATCTAAGYTGDEICLSCNNAKNRGLTIDAKGYKWDAGKVTTQSTDDAEGKFTYTCTNGCKHTKTEIIPRKSVSVELGKKAKIISNVSVCQKMTFAKASKYKKYLTFNTKTGEVKTKKYYKTKISKSIPVKVFVGGKEYTVNIKPKISAPKVKVSKKGIKVGGVKGYKYTFKYNIKGATKIKVRMQKGGSKAINKEFDRYISKQKSNKDSYILLAKKLTNKLGNKVTFKITAYYGKNQSETLTITK